MGVGGNDRGENDGGDGEGSSDGGSGRGRVMVVK